MFNLVQPEVIIAVLAASAMFATILLVAWPMLARDKLAPRMKSVALERDQIRARERARLASEKNDRGRTQVAKREPGALVKAIVDRLNLRKALADDSTMEQLTHAGMRGQAPLFVFLAARFILPLLFFVVALVVLFLVYENEFSTLMRGVIALGVAYAGFYAPIIFVKNRVKARQLSITRAWPDALDLCLICVESGMSIEAAFRKVAEEIGGQSIALAEELILTTAELSYLQDRRTAYENLSKRTGLDTVKGVMLTLIQAERYGTPLSQALRVLSQENRDRRMSLAEAKAAALPPKLTVPMIVFFLPVLFAVIMSPAIIKTMETFK